MNTHLASLYIPTQQTASIQRDLILLDKQTNKMKNNYDARVKEIQNYITSNIVRGVRGRHIKRYTIRCKAMFHDVARFIVDQFPLRCMCWYEGLQDPCYCTGTAE